MVSVMSENRQLNQKNAWVYRFMLSRPEKGNPLDPATIKLLHNSLTEAESSDSCIGFAIESKGKAFCSGADVFACAELSKRPNELLEFFDHARAFMLRLNSSRLITIAFINGVAVAGGLELAISCDLAIASQSSIFMDKHARYGFVPAFGSTVLLPAKIGYSAAAWLLLGDGNYTADEALRVGLVARIFSDFGFSNETERFLDSLKQLDSISLSTIKKLINQSMHTDEALIAEKAAVKQHFLRDGYDIDAIDF